MQDRTIDNALLALRKQIIRGNLDGLEHVEVLLVLRGIALPRVLPPWRENKARGHEIRQIILRALDGGPMALPEIAQAIAAARVEVYDKRLYQRTAQCLYKMKLAGMVRREGRAWGLV
ncbi:MAG: hypothetical protein KDK08_10835 [Rhizobiaceae bacterium]|nr:hypothetical protein [Rhizobiaceae bacterium]